MEVRRLGGWRDEGGKIGVEVQSDPQEYTKGQFEAPGKFSPSPMGHENVNWRPLSLVRNWSEALCWRKRIVQK